MIWEEPIHRSLHRPPLVLGGDRELVMFSALGAFLVAMGGFSLYSAIGAFVFWLVALHWLRKWGKTDPLLCRVYFQSQKYKKKYLAAKYVWSDSSPAMKNMRFSINSHYVHFNMAVIFFETQLFSPASKAFFKTGWIKHLEKAIKRVMARYPIFQL